MFRSTGSFAASIMGFALMLALAGPAAAQTIEGRFCGRLASGAEIVHAVTELRTTADGRLSGSYTFDDGGTASSGTLSELEAGEGRTRRLVWRDRYGSGTLVITFDQSLQSFRGLWGPGRSEPNARWDGRLCGTGT
ncbi:hypothetical protein BN1110_03975 [bacterium YEK0313]|nr:hypothetical protein BN1110_03975 [bacterium YEK0313]